MSGRKKKKKFKPPVNPLKLKEKKMDKELAKQLDFFITSPLRSANKLATKLYKDDKFYQQTKYAWVGANDAKKLFLYGVCKEVIKIIVELTQNKDTFSKVPVDEEKDFLGNVITGSFLDSQSLRLRKAIELLSLLILFSKNTTRDEEHRIYLSAENLDLEISRQNEFYDFFGEIISNTQHGIDDFSKRVSNDLTLLSKTELWFLDMVKFNAKKPSVFKSKRSIYLSALEVADEDQRVMMGISYRKTYSRLSMVAHPILGSHDYGDEESDWRQVIQNIPTISLVCMHIMKIAYSLAGEDDPGGIDKILGPNNEKSEASKFIAKMKSEFEIGDVVLTSWLDLVEITDKRVSKYGYKAYKVKFISKPPLPQFPEDWLEAQYILTILIRKAGIKQFMQKSFDMTNNPELKELAPKIISQSDEWLMENVKKTFLDLHNHKILVPMLIRNGHLKPKEKGLVSKYL